MDHFYQAGVGQAGAPGHFGMVLPRGAAWAAAPAPMDELHLFLQPRCPAPTPRRRLFLPEPASGSAAATPTPVWIRRRQPPMSIAPTLSRLP
mmetsp:Transcript_85651/g.183582  ORF Transcript_85651/g.183582 Transcript_85651/m.183582 type:complete len:92 (-) Transcript_85651:14-289(-)